MKQRNEHPRIKFWGLHVRWSEFQTAFTTEIASVLFVKWGIPSSPLSCWRPMTMAAPAMKPTMAACDRISIRNPNLLNENKDSNKIWFIVLKWQELTEKAGKNDTPEQPKRGLKNARKKSCRENKVSVSNWISQRILHLLNHWR